MKTRLLLCWLVGVSMILLMPPAGAQTAKDLNQIQLPNGITLQDWVDLKSKAEGQNVSLETGIEAAGYVQRYKAYHQGLIELVAQAAADEKYSPESVNAENAAQKLVLVNDARRKLGDWPGLLVAHARAAALTGDNATALSDLKRWISVVPSDYEGRTDVVALLLAAEKDQTAVDLWAKETGQTVTDSRWSIKGGLAYNRDTKLTWQRCAVGLVFSKKGCTGTIQMMTHAQALSQQSGGWRLPTLEELKSLLVKKASGCQMDEEVFPGQCSWYWTSEVVSGSPEYARGVGFSYGAVYNYRRSYTAHVRLVRSGQ